MGELKIELMQLEMFVAVVEERSYPANVHGLFWLSPIPYPLKPILVRE